MDLSNNQQQEQEQENHFTVDFTCPTNNNNNTRLASSSSSPQVLKFSETRVVKKRRKWCPTEDIVLCNSWLNTTKEVPPLVLVVGNDNNNNLYLEKAFWKRIATSFNASPKLKCFEKREFGCCKQRWRKINESVCKFLASYEEAMRQKSSDDVNDVSRVAYEIYFRDHKVKFNLEHAWIELRNDQRWRAMGQGVSNKKRKIDDDRSASSNAVTVAAKEVQGRHDEGVKKAGTKAKGKKMMMRNVIEVVDSDESETSTSIVAFRSMWAIKEKDLALRERLGKNKLLNSLLAKKEPLSELESALKDKLITDMLNN